MRTCTALLILILGARASAAEPNAGAESHAEQNPAAAPASSPDAMSEALSIPGDQLHSVPGTWGDPLRALGRFPGATTVIGGMGPLVVRGRLPDATPTYVDGVRVSWPYHALVGPAALSPQLLDRADYYRGEAPARFGFLTGGAIDLHLPEHVAGTTAIADLDLLTARATVLSTAGPLGTRVLASAAALYTPWLAARASNGVLEANLGDWQLSVAQPLWDGELRLLWLGAFDGVDLTQGNPDAPLDPLSPQYSFARARSQMQRVDLRWRSANGLEASATYGLDRLALAAGGAVSQSDLEAAERTLQGRVRWTGLFVARGRPIRVELGAEVERHQADFELGALVRPPPLDGPGIAVAYRPSAVGVLGGAWAQASGTDGALTVTPGLRLSTAHRAFHDTEVAFEPRLWLDYRGSDGYELHGGAGWYHQPVTTMVPLPGFQLLHLPEGMSSVVQASAGVTLHPMLGLDLVVDGYFDPMMRVVELPVLEHAAYTAVFADAADSAARVAARVTQGSAMGLEVLLRRSGDRFGGWLSYSFQRSVRTDPSLSKELPFAFEQSHVLNAVLEYRLPGGWTFSGAALLRSGAPEYGTWLTSPSKREGTDATGAAAWVPVPLDEAGRLPWLFRLDARVSKAFDLDRLRLEVWLDVYDLNLARDAFSYSYGTAQDASGRRVLVKGETGLWYPLPMLGVRGAWRP